MELRVIWVNSTRVGQEKERVEVAYQERLLELFDSAANAFVSKQQFELQHHPVGHTWQKYNILAHVDACKNLLPSEKHLAHFRVSFIDG